MDGEESDVQSGCFLAERFLSRCSEDVLATVMAAERAAAQDTSIIVLATIYVPDDETYFTFLRAPDVQAITDASERFHLEYQRILPAISRRADSSAGK